MNIESIKFVKDGVDRHGNAMKPHLRVVTCDAEDNTSLLTLHEPEARKLVSAINSALPPSTPTPTPAPTPETIGDAAPLDLQTSGALESSPLILPPGVELPPSMSSPSAPLVGRTGPVINTAEDFHRLPPQGKPGLSTT